MPTATVTSKGQITIPLPVRNRLRLKTGDRVDFALQPDGGVLLQPRRIPFEKLRGIARSPGRKPLSLRAIDKAIERAVVARWQRVAGKPADDRRRH
jgi:antitoxin PrlF